MQEDQRLTPLPKTASLRDIGEYPAAYQPYFEDDALAGGKTIRQYTDVVLKRLPWILALAIFVTAIAALYMYSQPSIYQATATMLIEPRKPKVTSKDAININFGNDINYYNTQLKLLQNTDLMRDVVVDLGLYRNTDLFKDRTRGVTGALRSLFSRNVEDTSSQLPTIQEAAEDESPDKPALTPEQDALSQRYAIQLVGSLTVAQRERTNLVDISVTSPDPTLAARVATRVAQNFKTQDAKREMQGSIQARDDLEKSIAELEGQISNQEAELISFMQQSRLPLQEKGQEVLASRLQGLSATWMKAMEERRQLESRYNAAATANRRGEGASIPELTENQIYAKAVEQATERKSKLQEDLRKLDQQMQEARTELAGLRVKYTDEHSDVQTAREKITSLESERKRLAEEMPKIIREDKQAVDRDAVSGALVSMRSLLESKRKEEAQAQAAYLREAQSANVQGIAETRLITLRRGIETGRNLLDTYTQRLKEQELAIANGSPDNIKIAAEATVPGAPIGPQRNRNIAIAFLLSLAAGIGLAFLMDYLDDSVRTSDDISRHVGLPTLALIPHQFANERRRLALPGMSSNLPAPVGTSIVTLEDRHSPMAEAYRHLRTSLLFSSAGHPPQTILVTSSQPSEGKTTTAINTAITLAQSDADVVIIDCDLRRPRLHSYFGLDNTVGITNYLSGEANTDNLIKECRDLPRLKVITSGPIPPNPAELLSSDEMRKLLDFLKTRYKHVVVDSPPAISFTDAAILSTVVDGVVLVAMAGKSSLHLMRKFKQRLGHIGARIYGVVLNGVKSNSTEYGYYGAGYYEYYTKRADDTTPMYEDVSSGPRNNGN